MKDRCFCLLLRSIGICSIGVALTLPSSAVAANPSPAAALSLKPVQQDVEYEQVAAENVNSCKVENYKRDDGTGWEVTSADGTLLRRFLDTDGDKKIDLWSYFNFGIEAYRDVDNNANGKADEYRWLGNSGTRWGIDQDEDGTIDSWKRISAEEVSAEIVAALRDQDAKRFANVLLSSKQLTELGIGQSKASEVASRLKAAKSQFEKVAGGQTKLGKDAKWIQFAAPAPGLVPAGTDGSTDDVLVYENVVAMYESDGNSGQLLIGTLVQVGNSWRAVGLPVMDGEQDSVARASGIFFSPAAPEVQSETASEGAAGMQDLVAELEKLDTQLASADEKSAPALHSARADIVEKIIANSESDEEKATWTRQLIDTVNVAVQSRRYPAGLKRLQGIAAKFARGDRALAAYADYQSIQAEYVLKQTPDADFEKVQKWYEETLSKFVDAHPQTIEAAQAMLQLALSKEFEDNEKEALVLYRKVRDSYKGTEPGDKAAGAVRRLESVGRQIELEGKTIEGKPFRLSQLRGRPVIVHYWATWCEPCKQDMKLLSRLATRYKRAGLTLVGVNVDARRADAESFLQANRLPWVQLFEEGGLESSPLSQAFGVQTLPTMMLIDKRGTVVRHNVRKEELENEMENMLK